MSHVVELCVKAAMFLSHLRSAWLLPHSVTAEHGTGCDYLRHIQFAPSTCQTDELLDTIAELHQSRRGQSSASAELEYLVNASRLSMYGVDLHTVLVIYIYLSLIHI